MSSPFLFFDDVNRESPKRSRSDTEPEPLSGSSQIKRQQCGFRGSNSSEMHVGYAGRASSYDLRTDGMKNFTSANSQH